MLEEKKQYEISYLAITEADKEAVIKILQELPADNIQEGKLTEIKLSYPIKKRTSALFGEIVFETLPDKIVKINDSLKFYEGILRFLIIALSTKRSYPCFGGKDKTIEEKEISSMEENNAEKTKITKEEKNIELEEHKKEESAVLDEKQE